MECAPASFHRRHHKPFTAEVKDLYRAGALRKHRRIDGLVTGGQFENPDPAAPRAVDGCLTAIPGARRPPDTVALTMEELLKENKRMELNLSGLRV